MMNQFLIVSLALLLSGPGFADGFVCKGAEETVTLAVYNSTSTPATRQAEIMVLSDPDFEYGSRTMAKFGRQDGALSNRGSRYVATINPRVRDSIRGNDLIAGLHVKDLSTLTLLVDFSYANPVDDGDELDAVLLLTPLSGNSVLVKMVCFRYLKGE